ncbi:hypothetical protein E4T56_gene2960 [Termitomyces sp. T112]|nr:hypothetical protein E4T56_gene2960 [Termitomyces sp. T112]
MRLNYSVILAVSLAVSSFAVPLFSRATEEEGLYLRWDDYDIDIRALTWHDVPSDKRYHQTKKLEPHPGEKDPHITYRTDKNGKVSNYQGWQHNEHAGKMTDAGRWRSEGKEHGGIKPPIYYPPTGKAHAAGPEHDPNSIPRLESLRPTPVKPTPISHTGQVTNYQGWQRNEHAGNMTNAGRWRGEGKEHGGIKPPIYYPPTGKAHAAGPEHDPNRSQSPTPDRSRSPSPKRG